MKRSTTIATLLLLLGGLHLPAWFDEVLFRSNATLAKLKPNIMFLLDNSGSMNTVIYPDGYVLNETTGLLEKDPTQSVGYDPKVNYGASGWSYVQSNSVGSYTLYSTSYPNVGRARVNSKDYYFYYEKYKNQSVRVDNNFLRYLFTTATEAQRAVWNHFMIYGQTKLTNTTRDDARKVRIRVANAAMQDILDGIWAKYDEEVAELGTSNVMTPRIGFTVFEGSDQGGEVLIRCHDVASIVSQKSTLNNKFYAYRNTPLAESLATIYGYFRYADKLHIYDHEYFYPFNSASAEQLTFNSGNTTKEWWCQKNFMVIVTDGEPTQDTYVEGNLPNNTIFGTDHHGVASWGPLTDNNTSSLVDDIAYYAYQNDLFPDTVVEADVGSTDFERHAKNKQNIFTYTVGFAFENDLLQKAAEHGGGEYFKANNKDALVDALLKVLGSIEEKIKSFASFVSPKFSLASTTYGGYVATFLPDEESSLWKGHLSRYSLDPVTGAFPDLNEPSAADWDAGEVIKSLSPGARNLYTGQFAAGNWARRAFDATHISNADLGVATDADRTAIINFVRGDNGLDRKLGDIFHFTPLVVTAPPKWRSDQNAAYKPFYDAYKNRTEVALAGGNDGMLHCFRVSDGVELWGYIPQSLLTKLATITPGVPNPSGWPAEKVHQYFVDGAGHVVDVQVDDNGDANDWKTLAVFSLGQGGRGIVVLDITNPENPDLLFEFSATHNPLQNEGMYLGYTMSTPLLGRVYDDGSGKSVPVVILAGGLDWINSVEMGGLSTSVRDQIKTHTGQYAFKATDSRLTSYDALRRRGKALWVLNAVTGEVIKTFRFDSSNSNSATLWTSNQLLYPVVATPTMVDLKGKGCIDMIYFCPSGSHVLTGTGEGGSVWRVSLEGTPVNWQPERLFQLDGEQTLYIKPTLALDQLYRRWVYLGTGNRPFPNAEDNANGKFLAFMDPMTAPSSPYTLSNLEQIVLGTTETVDVTGGTDKGFYMNLVQASREILFDPAPLIVSNQVIFNTYAPKVVDNSVDLCTPQGDQWLYTLSLGLEGVNPRIESAVEQGANKGSGLLNNETYVIYHGTGPAGDVPSNGAPPKQIAIPDASGLVFWMENKR